MKTSGTGKKGWTTKTQLRNWDKIQRVETEKTTRMNDSRDKVVNIKI